MMEQDKWELFKEQQPAKKAPRKIENSEFIIDYFIKRNKVISEMFYNGGEII